MDTQILMIVAVTIAVCALVGTIIWFAVDKARSRRLREHFGPEYDRVVQQTHDRNVAEAELENREKRVKKYHIVPLSAQDQANFRESWAAVQNRFVDDPQDAMKEGHGLIFEVMDRRGYPVTNFEQAAADLSVDYPNVVSNYRAASAIAARNRKGEATTEEQRQALVHYRALFHELLETPVTKVSHRQPAPSRLGARLRDFNKSRRGGLRS